MICIAGSLVIRLGQGLWCEVNGVNVTLPFQHHSGLLITLRPTAIDVYSESIGFKVSLVNDCIRKPDSHIDMLL